MSSCIKGLIQEWFDRTWGGGLILPDGWFGQPYGNTHRLTNLQHEEGKLTVQLDGQLNLVFYGDVLVRDEGDELIFTRYDELVFDWQEYGSMKSHLDKYSGGVTKLAAPPGM